MPVYIFLGGGGKGGIVLQTVSGHLAIQTFQQHWSHPRTTAVPLVRSICRRLLMSLKILDSLIRHVAPHRDSAKSACKWQAPSLRWRIIQVDVWRRALNNENEVEWNQLHRKVCVCLSFCHHSSPTETMRRKLLHSGESGYSLFQLY